MAKPTHPLLSLGAQGTLGNALTFQRTGGQQISRRKPHPRQPDTLEQWYQRWLYQNYIAYWHSLSAAEKETYRAAATLHKLPVFPYFLSFHLKNLPDVAGQWHLDNIIGGLTPDSSRQANDGSVYGPTLAPGLIGKALTFDGSDDYVYLGADSRYNNEEAISILLWLYTPEPSRNYAMLVSSADQDYHDIRFSATTGKIEGIIQTAISEAVTLSSSIVPPNTWTHLALTYDKDAGPNNVKLYFNGQLESTKTQTGALLATGAWYLGKRAGAYAYPGKIDEVTILFRALTATEILKHSERRYPPQ